MNLFYEYIIFYTYQNGCKTISGRNYGNTRNCLRYVLDYIVMQMRKVNREEGYCFVCPRYCLTINKFSFCLSLIGLEPRKFDLNSSFAVMSLQEGATAERVCKILESSLRSPHVPVQVNNFVICYVSTVPRVILRTISTRGIKFTL